ncbi:MAG: TerB family tellurite resistance protein [Wenyingzhuangia sp.]|jgi:DnaJ like chaperone protein|uniref:TerB family tellurite resistance protein n=1 Tax=Wenyingzhuangia sp. TaxID=1964193 RepID=UPI003218E48D
MRKFASWIGAGIGWAAGGPIGAALGYLIGTALKGAASDYSEFQADNIKNSSTQAGDFEISLLFLAAVVIKSDGKILQKELDYVRQYFVQMYGKQRANNAFKLFKGIVNDTSLSTQEVCYQIRNHMTIESRVQLIHFLFSIAKSDGHIAKIELETIQDISNYLLVSQTSFDALKAMFYNHTESAYQILEVSKSDDNDRIKKSYRRLVKLHHPDKLSHLGKEHLKGAQEKFLKIQQAYETLKKERGF